MEQLQALTDALAIVEKARLPLAGVNPAAWEFLYRVGQRITEQQRQAFAAAFGDTDPQEGAN